jgi:hypothetical protein
MNVKRIGLSVMLITLVAAGTLFAQQYNLLTEAQAYALGLIQGYSGGSISSPFTDSARATAWRSGYSDGTTAQSLAPSYYSLSQQNYASLFPNRTTQPGTAFERKRLGIQWSPIFKYKSTEYILGPDGVYEYQETAFGVKATLVYKSY